MIVRNYGDFGLSKWKYQPMCGELFGALESLESLLAEAVRVGATSTLAYKDAKAFFDRETNFLTYTRIFVPYGDTCNQLIVDTKAKIISLNKAVTASGGAPIAKGTLPTGEPPDITGAIKLAAGAGIVLGVIYLVGPLVRGVSKGIGRRIAS